MFINARGLVFNDGAHVKDGQGFGEVGSRLGQISFDCGLARPYLDEKGKPKVTINTGRKKWDEKTGAWKPIYKEVSPFELRKQGIDAPVANVTSLRKADWIAMQKKLVEVQRQRLSAWTDLAAASKIGGFDGYSHMTYEYEAVSDSGEAITDMFGESEGRVDTPLFKLRSVPLPIIHSNFWISDRQLAVSANSGRPLSTIAMEQCARRVSETVERNVIGTVTGMNYGTQSSAGYATHDGNSQVYGYTTFPARNTKTDLTTPTGTNPEAVMTDVLEMLDTMYGDGFFGPFVLYHSTSYSRYLNDDYFRSGSTSAVRTLRERILNIEGISAIKRLDYLTSGYQLILIQLDSSVAAAIEGMPMNVIQWDAKGGQIKMFKVWTIMTPILFSDYSGQCGIVHGTTS